MIRPPHPRPLRPTSRPTSRRGVLLASALLLTWLISLAGLLACRISALPSGLIVLAVLVRTMLQTGLFITAHDAMHGVLLPASRPWNHRLGALLLRLYAGLPYPVCWRNHQLHHRRSASERDPDFHGDPSAGVLRWYRRFMAGYLSAAQMAQLLAGWSVLAVVASRANPSAWINVLLFCTLPLLLSSLQLFVFGTYLPHRGQRQPGMERRPTSLAHPAWLSLLTCFHFGYHREHHDHPELAWFELPAQRSRASLTT